MTRRQDPQGQRSYRASAATASEAAASPPSPTPSQFQMLFENAPGLFLVLSPDFTIVSVTEAYLAATMTSREAIVGRHLFEVFPDNPRDPEATGVRNLTASLDTALRTKSPHRMMVQKYDIRKPEAEGGAFEVRYWSPLNSPVVDEHGEVIFIIHRVEDVTDLVGEREKHTSREQNLEGEIFKKTGELRTVKELLQAERTARQSEDQFRQLADAMPQLAWIANGDGWIFWYNPRWYEYTGTVPTQMEGWGWKAVHDPKELPRVMEAWEVSINTGQQFEMVFPMRGADGRFRPFLTRVMLLRDDKGKVIRWFGTNTDISDQKLAEGKLRAEQDKLSGIIGSAMDAIITVTDDQRITVFNRAAEGIFRCSAEQAIGRPLDDFIPVRFRGEHRDHVTRFGATGVTARSMYRPGTLYGLRADGEEFPLEASISQIEIDGKKLFTVILRDIGERKRIEDTLRHSEKLAAVGSLAATIAHEINNPLECLTNLLYLARKDKELSANTREFLLLADEELNRVAHLAKQTLGFYRDTSAPASIPVAEAIADVLAMYKRKLQSRDIEMVIEIDENLQVYGFGGEFRQVFSNLIVNAADAMSDSGGRLMVRARPAHDMRNGARPGVLIGVADTGTGIATNHFPKIFDAFFSTKKGTGTGLGLWISREIVEKHGGWIKAKTAERRGTVFGVFWPREGVRLVH